MDQRTGKVAWQVKMLPATPEDPEFVFRDDMIT